jgi:hypothetical protein
LGGVGLDAALRSHPACSTLKLSRKPRKQVRQEFCRKCTQDKKEKNKKKDQKNHVLPQKLLLTISPVIALVAVLMAVVAMVAAAYFDIPTATTLG